MNGIPSSSWRLAILAIGSILLSSSALAGDDDVPLSLSLTENISRDSNFAKNDGDKYGETVNATSLGATINKAYGRQTYQGGFTLTHNAYARNSNLDYDGKDGSGTITSEFLRNWLVSFNGSLSDALNPIQNNFGQDRVDKVIRKYWDGNVSVQYGNGGRWAVIGTVDRNKISFSNSLYSFMDASQHTLGGRLVYYSTDLLNYSLGYRRAVTDRPNNFATGFFQNTDRDIDLSVSYQATGLSNLTATLTKQNTTYVPTSFTGTNTVVGSLYWTYTPHGMLSYDLSASRYTGSDRYNQYVGTGTVFDYLQRINTDTLTTMLNGAVHMQLTGKIRLNASASLTQYKVDQASQAGFVVNGPTTTLNQTVSYGHTTTLSLDYAALRSVGLGCSIQEYSQGQDIYRPFAYHGRTYGCYGRFTLNPL